MRVWPERGIPDNPGAWITTTARNRAIDRLRRERTLREKTAQLGAIEASARMPVGPHGTVEIRPVAVYDEEGRPSM